MGADAYNNAALAWLRAGEPLKAKAWLGVTSAALSTTHNKGLVDATLASFRASASPVANTGSTLDLVVDSVHGWERTVTLIASA